MPKAVLKKENTTIKRVKLVITKINDGAKTKSVSRAMTLRVVTSCLGSLGAFKERLTLGSALSALIKGHIKGQMRASIKKMKKRTILALNL
ncbi:hypothetical protein HMPREF1451_00330 [Helicobacter pylori HP260BFii]|uniref:Uncharacterized protein n=1 Tax=Helicobacter pylori GAM260BSi TaxID=1159046 RepID=M3PK76_HELPX|nr:hypothetical protein HMPREF1418_00257 [Helicobacter pylori GAM260BSi]EMH69499.1 hypothetical protein HMPREF1451_00330 [Helicobacter pylori HP260BFii]